MNNNSKTSSQNKADDYNLHCGSYNMNYVGTLERKHCVYFDILRQRNKAEKLICYSLDLNPSGTILKNHLETINNN